jgi:xylose isomerase
MSDELKIDSGMASLSPCSDRFVPRGYRERRSLDEMLDQAASVKGLKAIAFGYPNGWDNAAEMKKKLADRGLGHGMLEVALYNETEWKLGSFTAPEEKQRLKAIQWGKEALDAAAEVGASDVQLWLGQDGYDYPFQVDYTAQWARLIDGIREVAEHRSDVRIVVEYKIKEPRARCHISTVGRVLQLVNEIGLAHVGCTLDVGHSLMAQENPAEAACLLARYNRLFHLHLNDCYRDWDHDMIPGSINFWELIEFFYHLERVKFDGWYGIDIYPYRENGVKALQMAVDTVYWARKLAKRLESTPLAELQRDHDALEIHKLLREQLIRQD